MNVYYVFETRWAHIWTVQWYLKNLMSHAIMYFSFINLDILFFMKGLNENVKVIFLFFLPPCLWVWHEEEKMVRVSANPLLSEPPPVAAGRKRGGGRQSLPAATEETEGTKQKTNFKTSSLCSSIAVWDLLLLPLNLLWTFSENSTFVSTFVSNLQLFLWLWGGKASTLKRRKTANPLQGDVPPATGDKEFPGVPQELFWDYTNPSDSPGSWSLGHCCHQQVWGLRSLCSLCGRVLLASHTRPLLSHSAEQAGPGTHPRRRTVVVNQCDTWLCCYIALFVCNRHHDLQNIKELLLQFATIQAHMSVHRLPHWLCVRLPDCQRLPSLSHIRLLQKVPGWADRGVKTQDRTHEGWGRATSPSCWEPWEGKQQPFSRLHTADFWKNIFSFLLKQRVWPPCLRLPGWSIPYKII